MEKDLTIGFVVVILNYKSIAAVNKSICTNISIDLLKGSEALCDIHASLSDDIGMSVESLPGKLYFLTALIIEHHFEGPTLPISCHQQIILSWFQKAANPCDFPFLVFASYPAVPIATISCH